MVKVYAVYDAKAAAFGNPVFQSTEGIMRRNFEDACSDPKSPLVQHSADYSLYEIGSYDQNSGKLEAIQPPVFIIAASTVVTARVNARVRLEPELPLVADTDSKVEVAK